MTNPTTPTRDPAATYEPTNSLRPWDRNPRKNDGAPVDRVAASIKRFGFAAPIVARASDRRIIAGHTRWKAARKLGLETVPVRFVDLDDDEAAALALADNRMTEATPWDDGVLVEVLSGLSTDLRDIAGWDPDELSKLLGKAADDVLDASPQIDGLTYRVIVECDDENAQAETIATLEAQGYRCQPLIS